MKGFKHVIRNFFSTTRAQTNGFIGVLIVMIVSISSQPLSRWWVSTRTQDFTADAAMLDSLTRNWQASVQASQAELEENVAISYFDFDPNVATAEAFVSLGLSEKLASRIINYRTKGGKFRIKSDLLKMYGMDSTLYGRLAPYIALPETYSKPGFEKKEYARTEKPPKEKPKLFNLNDADTTEFQKIYGIGSKLALRIVKYRDRLGGFVSQEQLREVYGLDTAVVKRIISASYLPDSPTVNRMNLNTADEKTLATHPYFPRKIANAIVAYRFQHGNFKSVDDLSRITLIDKNNLGKLFPYVTVDP